MIDFNATFITSQILVFIAIFFDFLSFQFKNRKGLFICLLISSILVSTHYFLLSKYLAGIIISFSTIRFITCCFSTKKIFMYLFIILNTITILFTYKEIFDILIYLGIVIMIIGSFQTNNQLLRKMMMIGSLFVISYNFLIISPMCVALEITFLTSNIVAYHRLFSLRIKTNKNIGISF